MNHPVTVAAEDLFLVLGLADLYAEVNASMNTPIGEPSAAALERVRHALSGRAGKEAKVLTFPVFRGIREGG